MPRQCLVTSCQWSLLASLYMAHVLYFELKFFWVFSTAKKVALKTLCPKSFFISLHRFSKVSFLLFLVYFKKWCFQTLMAPRNPFLLTCSLSVSGVDVVVHWAWLPRQLLSGWWLRTLTSCRALPGQRQDHWDLRLQGLVLTLFIVKTMFRSLFATHCHTIFLQTKCFALWKELFLLATWHYKNVATVSHLYK